MVVWSTVEGNSFDADKPRLWSDGHVTLRDGSGRSLDLHPDGDRFAVASEAQNGPEQKTLVFAPSRRRGAGRVRRRRLAFSESVKLK